MGDLSALTNGQPRAIWSIFFLCCTLPVVLYVGWQLRNLVGWRRAVALSRSVEAANHRGAQRGLPAVAIIVPYRNEAANLPRLADSLLAQDYPGPQEFLFVDDHSTDGGADLLPPQVRRLSLRDYLKGRPTVAHKKAALTYAIESTEATLVVTTDADCHWPPDRLRRIVAQYGAGNTDVVLGPVLIEPVRDACDGFQALDLVAYQFLTGATAGWGRPVLANGANFSFRRDRFLAAGGYGGVDHLPSGDDVLLLHKFTVGEQAAATGRVGYAADAAVSTRPVDGWGALWRQRLRWAGKAGEYVHPGLQVAQALAFVTSLTLLSLLFTLPWHLRPRPLLLLWGLKAAVDLLCLAVVLRHFERLSDLRWFPLATVIYPFFLVAVGTAALLGVKVGWKGR